MVTKSGQFKIMKVFIIALVSIVALLIGSAVVTVTSMASAKEMKLLNATPDENKNYTFKGKLKKKGNFQTTIVTKPTLAGRTILKVQLSKKCLSTKINVKQKQKTIFKKNIKKETTSTMVTVNSPLTVKLLTKKCKTNYTVNIKTFTLTENKPNASTDGLYPPIENDLYPPVKDDLYPPIENGVSVLSYGAVGDGITDDTTALQTAFNATTPSKPLIIPDGKIFKHTKILTIKNPNITIGGSGTLLAATEAQSSVVITANNVMLRDVTLTTPSTTKRWLAYEQMKLRLANVTGAKIHNIKIEGSAAAGVYVGGSSHFTFTKTQIANTRADGFHITESSHSGTLLDTTVTNPGDDGVAVVSYKAGNVAPVQNITITNPKLLNQKWGRAFSVVGGKNITWNNIYAEKSNAASIYISSEKEYDTQNTSNVTVNGGVINQANTNAAVDHGAIVLYNSVANNTNTNIVLKNLTIKDTRIGWSQIQIRGPHTQVDMHQLFFINGPSLTPYGVPSTGYNRSGWLRNNVPVSDLKTW